MPNQILPTLLQDARYALRRLRKSPGFTATAVLTLALGIGATTAIFTLVYQVMLRALPVSAPEQLFRLGKDVSSGVGTGVQNSWTLFSADLYRDLRARTPGIDGMAAVSSFSAQTNMRRSGDAPQAVQPMQLRFVSGNYFSVLGVAPERGRMLTETDDDSGAPPVVVISDQVWRTKLGADPRLIGSTLLLTGHPYTVVGIAAQGYLGEHNQPDPAGIWLPLAAEPVIEPDQTLLKRPDANFLNILLRLPHPDQASATEAALTGELRQWITSHAELYGPGTDARTIAQQTVPVVSASGGINALGAQYAHSLNLLLLVAGFVLLIACANLANLLLVRGMGRSQELALRSALGATRAGIIRGMLMEAVQLAMLGGVGALVLAFAGARAILALALPDVETSFVSATPSLAVIGFAFGVSLLTGLLFGSVPAWLASRSKPAEALRGAGRSTKDSGALPQKTLVVLQAALSLAMLSTAGVLITSLRQQEHQDFRFQPQGRLVVFTDLSSAGYKATGLPALYRHMDDALGRLPHMESFGYATTAPLTGSSYNTAVALPGVSPSRATLTGLDLVSPHYFETMGTRLLMGRYLNEQDTASSRPVAVVNAAFAKTILKGRNPIGEHFGRTVETPGEYEIVGVVDDTHYGDNGTASGDQVEAMYFTPLTQSFVYPKASDNKQQDFEHFANNLVFHYEGSGAQAEQAVRDGLRGLDPQIPILRIKTYTDQVSSTFNREELVVRLTTLFGALALLLATVGLYGVTTYMVARRTSEIGVRMALGATRGNVLGMVLNTALRQVGLGLLIGIPITIATGKLLEHSLFQTSGFQPLVMFTVIGLMLLFAVVAAALPARRAASIEPNQALRAE